MVVEGVVARCLRRLRSVESLAVEQRGGRVNHIVRELRGQELRSVEAVVVLRALSKVRCSPRTFLASVRLLPVPGPLDVECEVLAGLAAAGYRARVQTLGVWLGERAVPLIATGELDAHSTGILLRVLSSMKLPFARAALHNTFVASQEARKSNMILSSRTASSALFAMAHLRCDAPKYLASFEPLLFRSLITYFSIARAVWALACLKRYETIAKLAPIVRQSVSRMGPKSMGPIAWGMLQAWKGGERRNDMKSAFEAMQNKALRVGGGNRLFVDTDARRLSMLLESFMNGPAPLHTDVLRGVEQQALEMMPITLRCGLALLKQYAKAGTRAPRLADAIALAATEQVKLRSINELDMRHVGWLTYTCGAKESTVSTLFEALADRVVDPREPPLGKNTAISLISQLHHGEGPAPPGTIQTALFHLANRMDLSTCTDAQVSNCIKALRRARIRPYSFLRSTSEWVRKRAWEQLEGQAKGITPTLCASVLFYFAACRHHTNSLNLLQMVTQSMKSRPTPELPLSREDMGMLVRTVRAAVILRVRYPPLGVLLARELLLAAPSSPPPVSYLSSMEVLDLAKFFAALDSRHRYRYIMLALRNRICEVIAEVKAEIFEDLLIAFTQARVDTSLIKAAFSRTQGRRHGPPPSPLRRVQTRTPLDTLLAEWTGNRQRQRPRPRIQVDCDLNEEWDGHEWGGFQAGGGASSPASSR
eukprot:Sspe_Gene.72145::Locus_42965_Transcript_2_2_Confidence_0.667_Length_2194::g.72145::m.72145